MSDDQKALDDIAARLAAPFDLAEVKFKPATVSGNRALALPFVDARVVQDRLDDVLGVMGWQDSYEVLPDGAVVCRLKVRVNGEWITKEDVGGQSEQPDEGDRRKAAFSDALKRAAVKYGIGRYLYRQKPQWCDYDPQKRQFVRPPVLAATPAPATAATATTTDASPPASDDQRREIQGELERTGETIERLWAKLSVPHGTRLNVHQAARALKWLAQMPDATQANAQSKKARA